jgi:hypothetical protein
VWLHQNGAGNGAVSDWGYPNASITRLMAGWLWFLTFTQYFERPA